MKAIAPPVAVVVVHELQRGLHLLIGERPAPELIVDVVALAEQVVLIMSVNQM